MTYFCEGFQRDSAIRIVCESILVNAEHRYKKVVHRDSGGMIEARESLSGEPTEQPGRTFEDSDTDLCEKEVESEVEQQVIDGEDTDEDGVEEVLFDV